MKMWIKIFKKRLLFAFAEVKLFGILISRTENLLS